LKKTMSWLLMTQKAKEGRRGSNAREQFDRADADGDGLITKEEWFEILTKAGKKVTREELDLMFEMHDKDQNGKLSWQEFCGQESKNEKAFKLMDADHNGKITKNEFKRACHHLTKEQVDAVFKAFDASGDSQLNYNEFCNLMNSRSRRKEEEQKKEEEKEEEEEKKEEKEEGTM